MFRFQNTTTVPISREFVGRIAHLPSFKGDRERDTAAGKRRIAWLRRLLEEGRFHTPKWATAILLADGATYRVNGGHSSLMIANLPDELFPSDMHAIVDHFECETRLDLADLFDQFDATSSVRRELDRIKAHKGAHDNLDIVSPTHTSKIISGVALYFSDIGEGTRLSEEERVRLVDSQGDFLRWANQFVGPRRLHRPGVVAAMYATFRKHSSDATKFWSHVKDESHPVNTNPTRKLAHFLREVLQDTKKTSRPSRMFYVKSIHAWNAWRKDEPTGLKYYAHAELPVVL